MPIVGTCANMLSYSQVPILILYRFLIVHSRWKRTQPNTSRGGSGQRGSLPSYQSIGATPRRGVLKNGQSNAGTSSQGRTVTGRLFIVPAGCRIPTAGEECIICRDEPHYFPKNAPTPRCKHAAKVCFDCLKRTVKETVNAGYFDTDGHIVRCPNDTCNEWMSHSDVMTWADVETFERLVRAFLTVILGLNPLLQLREASKARFWGS